MATKVITTYVDDIDGTDAVETVKFALDGDLYEIDLNDINAQALRDALGKYIYHATKLGKVSARSGARTTTAAAKSDAMQNKAIREWARARGKKVSDRGRIPEGIIMEFEAEAGKPEPENAESAAPADLQLQQPADEAPSPVTEKPKRARRTTAKRS